VEVVDHVVPQRPYTRDLKNMALREKPSTKEQFSLPNPVVHKQRFRELGTQKKEKLALAAFETVNVAMVTRQFNLEPCMDPLGQADDSASKLHFLNSLRGSGTARLRG
jgi:hypothetical protein